MKNYLQKYKYTLITALLTVILLAIWEIVARIIAKDLILPTFSAVFIEFLRLFSKEIFYTSLSATLLRCVIGYVSGFVLGVVCGITAGKYPAFHAAMKPFIAVMRATPVAALTILLYLWVGSNILPPIIGIMLIFPVIFEQIRTATASIPPELEDVLQEMGSGFLHSARTVYLPLVLPHTLSVISATFGMNLKAVITAEVLASSIPSIGRQIYFANQNVIYEINTLFAWVLVAIIVSVIFETLLKIICKKLTEKISWMVVR
ncbi:MAG: ABC transporter permease subunit [Clostridia bacterium]|nr:ABC transporter permease subunit [Clostridia bacterium]